MKKIALISSYCDTQEKLDVLNSNIKVLKSLGLDVFVISPIPIQIEVDFLFITKENPILTHLHKRISWWAKHSYQEKTLKLIRHFPDYGWASLYQIKKIMEFASTLDYDNFYLMIYDLIINDSIQNKIISDDVNITFPRRDFVNKNQIYPSSFHFSIFDKSKLIEISNKIDFHDYSSNDGFAEDFIEKWTNDLSMKKDEIVVEDSINNTPYKNYLNYSTSENFNLFFSKEPDCKLQVFIYNCFKPIILKIDDFEYYIDDEKFFIETELYEPKNIFRVSTGEHDYNFLEIYRDTLNNLIQQEI